MRLEGGVQEEHWSRAGRHGGACHHKIAAGTKPAPAVDGLRGFPALGKAELVFEHPQVNRRDIPSLVTPIASHKPL